jgi:flagellar biosynthetic protein FliR
VNALLDVSQAEALRFGLIVARVTPLFVMAPVWGSPLVPAQLRIFIALGVSALLVPVVRTPLPAGVLTSAAALAFAVATELLVGFLIAYAALLVFAAAQLAGQLMDVQMGFGIANVIDPITSAQVTVVGQLQYVAALFVFLLLDGHHLLLTGLADTFAAAPLGRPLSGAAPLALIVERGGTLLFVLAVRIAAPVLTALFLVNLAMGLASRMLPQMNLFLVGMPLNVAVGLAVLAAGLPLFSLVWRGAILELGTELGDLARLMSGGTRGG